MHNKQPIDPPLVRAEDATPIGTAPAETDGKRAKALKLLEAMVQPCEDQRKSGEHEWRKCRRCLAHQLAEEAHGTELLAGLFTELQRGHASALGESSSSLAGRLRAVDAKDAEWWDRRRIVSPDPLEGFYLLLPEDRDELEAAVRPLPPETPAPLVAIPSDWADSANSARGLCESEARRWETASPKTAEHWRLVAAHLGALYLTQDHISAPPLPIPETPHE